MIDGEEGLQNVYYKQNIIAKIYAIADWFSPADIEAPTIEWVEFYDRKTFKKMLIDEISDLRGNRTVNRHSSILGSRSGRIEFSERTDTNAGQTSGS